jgi:hypothetical protein
MIGKLFKRWREVRAATAAERAQVELKFESFVRETLPLVPTASKNPVAALYRHAWKRAAVLEILYQRNADEAQAALYREFQKLTSKQYYRVAPVGPYGPIRLRIEAAAANRLLQEETRRLSPGSATGQR